ncbi:MAG: class I SAM-dependent methyltransferase [Bacteroidales bacterium]|nr:class I SAM-dependent methyltransferase [Bacteroidales bacterium]MCF8405854.1 class I SAM-dependent methyltransferase [Bacteroidales bacterium]
MNSLFEKISIVWKRGSSISDWQRSLWGKQLPGEIEYWDQWLNDRNNKSFIFRLDPNSKIQDWLTVYLDRNLKINRILDVGSGPLSNIGKQCDFCKLEIVCCDVLANDYHTLLLKKGIKAPHQIIPTEGEHLTSVFQENEFNIVFSNNAIDHTYDAVKTISEMIKTAKVGGFVVIQVAEKEGQRNLYRGLHQWDFYAMNSQFMLKRRHMKELDIGARFKHLAEIVELSYVDTNPAGLAWDHPHIRIVLKKISD